METMLADIANEQSRRGLRVTVVVVNDEIDPLMIRRFAPTVSVITMRRRRGSMPLLMMAPRHQKPPCRDERTAFQEGCSPH